MEYKGEKLDIKTGRYGPYLTHKGKNYSIYKTYDVDNLSEEDITKIISYKKGKSKTDYIVKSDKDKVNKKKITEKKEKKEIKRKKKVNKNKS